VWVYTQNKRKLLAIDDAYVADWNRIETTAKGSPEQLGVYEDELEALATLHSLHTAISWNDKIFRMPPKGWLYYLECNTCGRKLDKRKDALYSNGEVFVCQECSKSGSFEKAENVWGSLPPFISEKLEEQSRRC